LGESKRAKGRAVSNEIQQMTKLLPERDYSQTCAVRRLFMAIERLCPHCQAVCAVPDDAVGRLALLLPAGVSPAKAEQHNNKPAIDRKLAHMELSSK
jgi:hypothetical protein